MNRKFNHDTGEYDEDPVVIENNATDEEKKIFVDSHKELSDLASYPPFSTHEGKAAELGSAMMDEENRFMTADDKSRPHSTIRVKFADDLDEAMLYKKRYGNHADAQKAAMELNNISPDSPHLMRFG